MFLVLLVRSMAIWPGQKWGRSDSHSCGFNAYLDIALFGQAPGVCYVQLVQYVLKYWLTFSDCLKEKFNFTSIDCIFIKLNYCQGFKSNKKLFVHVSKIRGQKEDKVGVYWHLNVWRSCIFPENTFTGVILIIPHSNAPYYHDDIFTHRTWIFFHTKTGCDGGDQQFFHLLCWIFILMCVPLLRYLLGTRQYTTLTT